MVQSKGASLDPSTHAGGGQVPNGDYDLVKSRAVVFTYPGTSTQVPAILITYREGGAEYEQMYKAGDLDHLVPTDDGKRFVHPQGESAAIYKGGAASLFLGSLAKQNFQFNGDDVSQIEGIRVTLESLPGPKGKGADNPERMIPMVVKILKGKGVKTVARPTAPAATTAASPATSSAPAVSNNGELDTIAIQAVIQALDNAPEKTLKIKGLAVRCLKYAQGAKLNDLAKLLTPEWLEAQAEATGWAVDEEQVVMS